MQRRYGLLLLLIGSVVLFVYSGLISTSAQFPTEFLLHPQPLYVTQTAYFLNSVPGYGQTAAAATATTENLFATYSLYPTATAFFRQATETQQAARTATEQYWRDVYPEYAATALFRQRTQTESAMQKATTLQNVTATAYSWRATAARVAQLTATAAAPLAATSDALLHLPPDVQAMVTLTAGQTATTEFLLHSQPLYVTATAHIRGATQTRAAPLTTTADLLSLSPAFQMATASAQPTATDTRTPQPTQTPIPAKETFVQNVQETAAALLTISPTPPPPSATFAPETATVAARRVNTLFGYETATAAIQTAVRQTRAATTPSPTPTPIPQTETAAAQGTQAAHATQIAYHYSMEQTAFADLRNSLILTDAAEIDLSATQTQEALATQIVDPTTAYLLDTQPLYVTATAHAAGTTQTQEALVTQRADPTTAYLLDTQPLYVTATAFIVGATQTQEALLTPTIDATLEFLLKTQPLYVTATAFIVGATQTQEAFMTPSSTLDPTLNPSKEQVLRDRLQGELEAAFGFYHPVFDEVLDRRIRSLMGKDREYIAGTHMQSEIRHLTYNDRTYVAAIVKEADYDLHGSFRFLVFRLDDDTPILVYDPYDSEIHLGQWLYFPDNDRLYDTFYERGNAAFFADRNGNSSPELLIYSEGHVSSSGTVGNATLALLEFQPDGTVSPITPSLGIMSLIDLDGDGIMEIKRQETISNPFWLSKGAYRVIRWYAWDGTAYRDITSTLVDYYQFYIDRFWEYFEAQTMCAVSPARDMDVPSALMNYKAIGQIEQGWSLIWPRLYGELCPEGYPPNDYQSGHEFWEWVDRLRRSPKPE